MDSIILKNITKTFSVKIIENKGNKKLIALENVSFNIPKGEMVGIIGKNGSGKTTLLKILAKIITPDEGSVNVEGKVTPFLELGTGFNGELTARDNIILYGVILGFNKKEIEKKIDDIAKFAELEKFIDTKLKNFSSGMNARLAYSTAIQVNPDILLVDEVLAVGDAPFQKKSFESFLSFKKSGKTIVYVSHSLDHIKNLCDKALILHKGNMITFGNPEDVINNYKQILGDKPDEEITAMSPWVHDFSKLGIFMDSVTYEQTGVKNQPHIEPIITKLLSMSLKGIKKKRPTLLDMFCTDGYYSLYALETFHLGKVVLVDDRENMIERAKIICKRLGFDQVEFRNQNANSIDASEKFDVILNVANLRKQEDPRKTLEKTYNITNKFAIIQSAVISKAEDPDYFRSPDPERGYGSTFTDSKLKKWLEEFDWEIIAHEKSKLNVSNNLDSSFFLTKKKN